MAQCLDSLNRLGNLFELEFNIDRDKLREEIEGYPEGWRIFNPSQTQWLLSGISLVSLDGGFTGAADLMPLSEYFARHQERLQEMDFRVVTPALLACKSLREWFDYFHEWLARTYVLRFTCGSYFPPHRENVAGDEMFQLIIPFGNMTESNSVFIYGEERVILQSGTVYFVNPRIRHSMFSFAENVYLLKANVIANEASCHALRRRMVER